MFSLLNDKKYSSVTKCKDLVCLVDKTLLFDEWDWPCLSDVIYTLE